MHHQIARCLIVLTVLFFVGTVAADTHSFICADSGLKKLMMFSPEGKVAWEYDGADCYDVSLLPNGNILFCHTTTDKSYVREITKEKKVVFEYPLTGEIFSCQRLENGNTLVGCCTAGKLEEVTPQGKVVKTITLKSETKGHSLMRWARTTPWGTYLVAHIGDKVVREYNDKSEVIREIKTRAYAFGVIPLPNKNILISTETEILEITPDDKVVWTLSGKDIPEAGAAWLAGIRRLPNGNLLVCNWLGHGKEGTGYPLFEVTPDKKMVWKFTDAQQTKWIASAQYLD
jgi:hypothetical protein